MQSVEERNAKKRQKRLEERIKRLEGKKCLNCEILLVARLIDKGRSYLYCRKCLTEYSKEAARNRWRRYYYRKKGQTFKENKQSTSSYIVSWRTIKQQ